MIGKINVSKEIQGELIYVICEAEKEVNVRLGSESVVVDAVQALNNVPNGLPKGQTILRFLEECRKIGFPNFQEVIVEKEDY